MKQLQRRLVLLLSFLSLWGGVVNAQDIQVSGKVTDASSGEPVPGAAIMVKGVANGVISDMDGVFTISVAPDATLICSCIGYKEVAAAVNKRAVVNFSLAVDAEMLDETVVVGYGTLKKSQLVGSVEQLAGDVLEDRVNADVTRSLQGQVPGLSIFQSDGKPTHGGSIYIRGGATNYVMKKNMSSKDMTEYSIGQGGSALVLIDGVEGELSSVNPDDIESVTVLKTHLRLQSTVLVRLMV